jgi:hypothetical protein
MAALLLHSVGEERDEECVEHVILSAIFYFLAIFLTDSCEGIIAEFAMVLPKII